MYPLYICICFNSSSLPLFLSLFLFHFLLADWEQRYAALMSISSIAEGCEKHMAPILNDVVTSILPYCQDPVSNMVYVTCDFYAVCVCVCLLLVL